MSYNEEDEKNFEWAVKKSYLENIEYMKQKIKEQGKKEVDGFFVKLLVAATKNIQIFINNVHVVYEDSSTNAKNGCFQVGANFSKLVFETELDRKSINDNIIHKLVKLEGLAVYMNVDSKTKKVEPIISFLLMYFLIYLYFRLDVYQFWKAVKLMKYWKVKYLPMDSL